MSYSSQVIADGPALYWKLDEKAGSTAADSSGHGITGTYVAATLGQAALLVGDSAPSSISFPTATVDLTSAGVDTSSGDWSIEVWLKPSSVAALAAIIGADFQGYALGMASGGAVRVSVSGVDDDTGSTITMTAGSVYHVVVTFVDATSTIQYWLNATDAGSHTYATAPTAATKTATSSNSTVFPYSGQLEALAIYSRKLSAAEVANHYSLGLSAGPIGAFQ